ncbi:MAG: alpha/beta hydrolase, partial [Huintestinicola sp.]
MENISEKKAIGRGKIVRIIVTVILVLLIAIEVLASNYLVTFAIKRKETGGSDVAPPPATSEEARLLVDENTKRLSEATDEWMKTAVTESAELISRDGLTLKADIFLNEADTDRWAVVVHGYTSERTNMYNLAHMYAEHGYNVLVPDMRAHGESEGNYIGMGWPDRYDLLGWTDLICSRNANAEIVLHGVSMGGAAVMMTSGEQLPTNVRAVVEDCGYTSVWDIFCDELEYLFGLPEFPLLYTASAISKLRAGYSFTEASAIEQIRKADVPILFIHGSKDNFVKTEMIYELYDACPTEKDMMIVDEAGHGQAFYYEP